MTADDLERVRKAKSHFAKEYGSQDWCTGIGIARGPQGFELRVNVDPAWRTRLTDLPSEVDGVPIQIVYIDSYRARDQE
jgi:hypothetical protein